MTTMLNGQFPYLIIWVIKFFPTICQRDKSRICAVNELVSLKRSLCQLTISLNASTTNKGGVIPITNHFKARQLRTCFQVARRHIIENTPTNRIPSFLTQAEKPANKPARISKPFWEVRRYS